MSTWQAAGALRYAAPHLLEHKEEAQRCSPYCGWTNSCTTLKLWETIVCWYLQGNHYPRVSWVVQIWSIHSKVSLCCPRRVCGLKPRRVSNWGSLQLFCDFLFFLPLAQAEFPTSAFNMGRKGTVSVMYTLPKPAPREAKSMHRIALGQIIAIGAESCAAVTSH